MSKTHIIRYQEYLWTLRDSHYDMNDEIIHALRWTERKHDLLVYYLHLLHSKERKHTLSMLYVNRNIDEWEHTRKRTLEGNPDACVKLLDSDKPSNFEDIAIRIIEGCMFRL